MKIILGKSTEHTLNAILRETAGFKDIGKRIDCLSRLFLGVEYQDNTLIGDENKREVFVINLAGVDCFTFLEYVEAMRVSGSFSGFTENVRKVRYRSGNVTYGSRNHFFTDWPEFNTSRVEDVTRRIGQEQTVSAEKTLNQRKDGTLLLKGVDCRNRLVSYIPSHSMNEAVLSRMQKGDYAGVYSELPELDVTHVGIIIRDRGQLWFRHASSNRENRKVVDQEFIGYMSDKSGVVILRPKEIDGI